MASIGEKGPCFEQEAEMLSEEVCRDLKVHTDSRTHEMVPDLGSDQLGTAKSGTRSYDSYT